MPISRDEFDQGRIDLALPITHLLATSPHLAFTVEEVRLLLLDTVAREVAPDEVQEVLESLASGGQVQAKEIEGRWWYTYYKFEERQLGFFREQR